MSTLLRGVITASATPIHADGTPDIQRLVTHLRKLLDEGCDGINLLGTTGEANSFSLAQRLAIMKALREAGMPLQRFMVGTGVCSLEETVQLTQAANDLGYAGALLLPPFFYPGLEPQALVNYFDALVGRLKPTGIQLYLYHIPQNTGIAWPVEVVAQLQKKHPKLLRGIKDSSGDLSYSRGIVSAVPGFDVFPSSEGTLYEANASGFAGCISASTNITSQDSQIAWSRQGTPEGKAAKDRAVAQRTVLARESLVASVKAALAARYNDPAWQQTCAPLLPRTAEQSRQLVADLASAIR